MCGSDTILACVPQSNARFLSDRTESIRLLYFFEARQVNLNIVQCKRLSYLTLCPSTYGYHSRSAILDR
jgi:hypothetical protein